MVSDRAHPSEKGLFERERLRAATDLPARLAALAERFSGDYDTRPVSRAEWDAASGDDD
jgi:hypothetical protein